MVATEHVRNIIYAGPAEVTRELGDRLQHLLRCDCGVDDMEI